MKYTKRFLALFLALCMMFTSVPLNVNATEGTPSEVATEAPAQDDDQTVTEEETSVDDSEDEESEDSDEVTADTEHPSEEESSDEVTSDTEEDVRQNEKSVDAETDEAVEDEMSDAKGKDSGNAMPADKIVLDQAQKNKKKSAEEVVLQTTALEGEENLYTVMAASDFQASNDSAGASNVKAILEKISGDYSTMDGFMFGGDLSQSMSTSASASGKTALQNTVHEYYTGMDEFYVQGNHDPDNTVGSTCTASGANDTDNYGVYVINEKDYPWGYYESSSSSSYKSTVQATANALDAYLDAKVEAEYSEPIFVLSHIPLHYTTRTSGQNDAMHANLLFDVLNEGGDKGLNIIFLFGHNHSTAYDSYLGQGAIYLAEGDKINIAQGSTTSYNEETLNFTYMNYGYVGYIGTTDADAALTMTVFEITDDEVVVKRYSKDGVHNLKAAGGSTSKPGGVSVNSTVYSSPQTIELNEFEPAAALTGITVTAPTKTAYVVGDELDTTGMVVTAAYDDGTTKEVTGYEVSADFSSAGTKTVTVSYKEMTATFEVTVYAPAKDETTGITVTVPGVTGLTVTKITEEVPVGSGYSAYVSYDITPVGYNQGDKAIVTVPVGDAFDAGKPVVVLDGGSVLTTTTIKNGTVTFTATHFSEYSVAQDAQSELDWKEIPGGIVYQLDTDGVTGGTKYLIVNTGANGAGKALKNVKGKEDTTDVSISGGTINLEDDTAVAWTPNDANSGHFKNQDYYLRIPTNTYSDLVTGSSSTIKINNVGDGAYQLYVEGSSGSWPNWGSTSKYYLAYSNGIWHAVTTESNVYLYECKGTGNGGYAAMTGITVYQVVTGITTEDALKKQIQDKLVVYTAADANGTEANTTDAYTLTGNVNPTVAGEYTYIVTYGGVTLGTITVNVVDKEIKEIVLSDNSGSVNKGASSAAKTGASLTIKYKDDTSSDPIPVTVGMLTDADGNKVSTSTVGTITDLFVNYNGQKFPFTLTVNPKEGNNYPAYPNEGSVSLDKTATGIDFQASGVAAVELSAKGIPMNQGVDVLLILDTSSSMEFRGSLDSGTRIGVLKDCVDALIQSLKAPREDGSTPDVDIAIVDFNGYTGNKNQNYIGTKARDVDTIGGLLTNGWVSVQTLEDNWGTTAGNIPQGSGTNYDHGLLQGYELLSQKQSDEPGRKQFVLFMSDGAPFQYNGVNSNSVKEDWEKWILGSYTKEEVEAIETIQNPEFYYGNNGGKGQKHRIAEAIKGSPDETYQIVSYSDESSSGVAKMEEVAGLGATMYSVGLALEDENMPTDVAGQEAILKTIASSEDVFYSVISAAGLEEAFDDFATAILLAATNARFVDEMGSMYDLQLGNISYLPTGETNESKKKTISQQIEVISYDVYTREEVVNGAMNMELIGDRKGTSTVLETVTFNTDGTEAYSNWEENKENNDILVSGVINADTFFYNTTAEAVMIDTNGDGNTDYSLGSETFYWKIGDLKTTEMAIRYNVYLTGSLEGECEQGSYPTNNSAVLYYDNYLGNACRQSVASPQMAWKGANVSYAFYLVDASSGKPVNMNGTEVPFSERTVIVDPTLYDTILLNSDTTAESIDIAAKGVLPGGYWLYDEDSAYKVNVGSNATGSWLITTGTDKVLSTYVTGFKGNEYSNAAIVEDTSYDYTHTTVWFAVRWQPQTVPDTIVVDYGLPVDVHVLTNDMFGDYGKLVGVTKGNVENNHQNNLITTTEATGSFGTAKVNVPSTGYTEANSLIRYTPNTMSMNGRDVFSYSVQYANPVEHTDDGFYYGTLTVIPATTIYYEDDFVRYSSYIWDEDKNVWEKREESLWSKVTDEAYVSDKVITQDEDRPGNVNYAFDTVIDANNIYGYDNAYKECAKYSLGSAMKATVDYDNYGAAEFTFWGTGFDVISMTSNETGTVLVYVYDEKGNEVRTNIVDTYYGYTFVSKGMNEDEVVDAGEGEWVTSVNNPNALYQIPVIEIAGLEYGKYDVVLKAMYDPAFDHNKDNDKDAKFDFYLDAIRIYDPANDGFADEKEDTTIEDAYIDDHEGWPVYEELRNNVIEAAVYNETSDEAVIDGIVFIDSQDETASVEDYMNYGPNNELYLAPQQAIAFALDLSAYVDQKGATIVDTVQLGMKSADGGVVSYKMFDASMITNQDDVEAAKATELKTSTGMYYDITELGDKTIVIYNSGTSGTLSLTDIKITFTQDPEVVENLFRVSATSVKNILDNMNKVPETKFVPTSLDISTSPSKVYVGNKITVKVTTSAEVEGISVDGALLTSYSTNRNGKRIWTGKVSAKVAGTQSINVIAYNVDGLASDTYSNEVTVSGVNSIGSAIGSVINKLFNWLFT